MYLKKPINSDDHYLGNLNAPVSLVLYGDYECGICAKNFLWIPRLLHDFKNSVVFAYRHFPLTFIHPHSAIAAVAAEASAEYGKFWELHELLFKNHSKLSGEAILNMASKLGIDPDRFMLDLEDNHLMEEIINDILEAEESGVETTPTFFLNGSKLSGIVNFETLSTDISHLLRESQVHW